MKGVSTKGPSKRDCPINRIHWSVVSSDIPKKWYELPEFTITPVCPITSSIVAIAARLVPVGGTQNRAWVGGPYILHGAEHLNRLLGHRHLRAHYKWNRCHC